MPEALARGNTLRRPACVHWVGKDAARWLGAQRAAGTRIVGIELADEAVRLADLPVARQRTVAVLGHEQTGIPPEGLELLDVAVEIPMIGIGASLNVAVLARWCSTVWPGSSEADQSVAAAPPAWALARAASSSAAAAARAATNAAGSWSIRDDTAIPS